MYGYAKVSASYITEVSLNSLIWKHWKIFGDEKILSIKIKSGMLHLVEPT